MVQFLIDGRPFLDGTRLSDWLGFDPDAMLADDHPLLPTTWRRVAVARCSCGEAGCGVVAPVTAMRSDGTVRRTDFRDYTSVFAGPTVKKDPDGGHEHGLPELRVDRAQYEAEVRRATSDRTWETARRATARLVARRLGDDRSKLDGLGYRLDWVAPERSADAVLISLTKDGQQQLLSIPFDGRSPETRAEKATAAIWATPPAEWSTVFAGRR